MTITLYLAGLTWLQENVSQYNPEICHGRHCSFICQNLTQRQSLRLDPMGSKSAIKSWENAAFRKKVFSGDVRLPCRDTIAETGGITKRDTIPSVGPLEAGVSSRRAKLADHGRFALQMRWEVLFMMPLKELLRRLLFCTPVVGARYRELYEIAVRYHRLNPGHYSSPIPSDEDIARTAAGPDATVDAELPGISLRTSPQLELLSRLEELATTHPFTDKAEPGQRYFFSNDWFQYTDALVLHGLLRHFLPKRIVEVGSGFSSFVILDTIQKDPRLQCRVTLIEPNSERLRSRLSLNDEDNVELINSEVQRTSPIWFEQLEANDVLLIDSSHVSKCGSDVNFIVHEVLPRLKPGVLVHFHDIFYPFEYPEAHLRNSNHWNEAYILRAYLMHNERYEIVMWNHYVKLFFGHQFPKILDPSRKDLACSLWLRRV